MWPSLAESAASLPRCAWASLPTICGKRRHRTEIKGKQRKCRFGIAAQCVERGKLFTGNLKIIVDKAEQCAYLLINKTENNKQPGDKMRRTNNMGGAFSGEFDMIECTEAEREEAVSRARRTYRPRRIQHVRIVINGECVARCQPDRR